MSYDVIIVGGGHNGLTAAGILAKAGKKVLLLEKRSRAGGVAGASDIFPGMAINTGSNDAGLLNPEVQEKLNLKGHGLQWLDSNVAAFAPQTDGEGLTLWQDVAKSQAEIARFSAADAEKFPAFVEQMNRFGAIWRHLLTLTPPLPKSINWHDIPGLLGAGIKLKKLGKKDMMAFLRVLPMPVQDFLDEWFESDILKGLLGSAGVAGSMLGPVSAGSFLIMLHHYSGVENGGFRSVRFVKGGMGKLIASLADAARSNGAEILCDAPVSRIVLDDDDKAIGVELDSGEVYQGKIILSNTSPRHTLLEMVGPEALPLKTVRRLDNVRYQGVTARLNIHLKNLPVFPSAGENNERISGYIVICPSLEYLERAYDDAKYGRVSRQPYLSITIPTLLDASLAAAGEHLMSVTMQYAPYALRKGDWQKEGAKLEKLILTTLEKYAPGLGKEIRQTCLQTPVDWESEYGLPEGNIFHGQMGLDQLAFMRPIPGYPQYHTAIENLLLCGAGTHPGGGVTGAPGYNAAREALRLLK